MFRIQITCIEEEPDVKCEYQRVADTGNPRDGGPIYEYVKSSCIKKKETEIFDQSVKEIDLVKIIKAVNGIDT